MMSNLTDAIRDVLTELDDADQEASNREVAVEVRRRYPGLVAELGELLATDALCAKIRRLRKRGGVQLHSEHSSQLALPTMAKDLAPRLPPEIPHYPPELDPVVDTIFDVPADVRGLYERVGDQWHLKEDAIDADEIPWGNFWKSTKGHVRRYLKKDSAAIQAHQDRHRAVVEILEMADHRKGGEDDRIIDILNDTVGTPARLH